MSWYHWIADVFQNPSDIAQFLAIFTSSIVAISVVLLNQYFNRRSSRRSLYIEKIESFYQSILASRNASHLFLSHLYSINKEEKELTRLLHLTSEHIRDAEVFAHLYFPEIKLNSFKIMALLTIKKENMNSKNTMVRALNKQRQLPKDLAEINLIYDSLTQECKCIIGKFKH